MSESCSPLPGIEGNFRWIGAPVESHLGDREVSISSGGSTDWFVDPESRETTFNAPALVRRVQGDFSVSALIDVEFRATFDAGALVLYGDRQHWVKFALEFSPQGKGAVVSVVTRGESDESLSRVLDNSALSLRVSRVGRTVALHSSRDGVWWNLERYFRFNVDEVDVGFLSQSPTGPGTTARFRNITVRASGVANFRDGS
jgi:regulation of enolase protein 1 (concanavalin A-like superfamily)